MSTIRSRRKLLMPHAQRQALIRKPFHIAYISSTQRWGGVQIISDESWMETAKAHLKRYAQGQDTYPAFDSAIKVMEAAG